MTVNLDEMLLFFFCFHVNFYVRNIQFCFISFYFKLIESLSLKKRYIIKNS